MNQMVTSQVFTRTVASVQAPLQHFIETGFWNPHALEGWEEGDITEHVVRGSCRIMSKELKRPFIRAHPSYSWQHQPVDPETNYAPPPLRIFRCGVVEVPKRKYLAPLIAPLTLAATSDSKTIRDASGATLWEFYIYDRQLWDQYYQYLLNDPDCRKARKLAPLTQ